MQFSGVHRTRRLFFMAVVSFVTFVQMGAKAGSVDRCGTDGFCTLISVQNEVEQRSPSAPGVVIGTIGDDGFKPSSTGQLSAKKVCKKEVRVPRAVHDAVTRMFETVTLRGGPQSLPASLTSSEQTMLLYYNTIMQQTMNFQCSGI